MKPSLTRISDRSRNSKQRNRLSGLSNTIGKQRVPINISTGLFSRKAYCRICNCAVEAQGAWPGWCTQCGGFIEMSPVRTICGRDIHLLFVGINPGIQTARVRHHFAGSRNSFWKLLFEAGFTSRQLSPHEEENLKREKLGVTNIVTRATPSSTDIRKEDLAYGRACLERLLRKYKPQWIGFVGKVAYEMAAKEEHCRLGLQPSLFFDARTFVLPSTSPANTGVSPKNKLRWFIEFYRRSFGSLNEKNAQTQKSDSY
jgi:double-stranded uracil-DNA glycosylase